MSAFQCPRPFFYLSLKYIISLAGSVFVRVFKQAYFYVGLLPTSLPAEVTKLCTSYSTYHSLCRPPIGTHELWIPIALIIQTICCSQYFRLYSFTHVISHIQTITHLVQIIVRVSDLTGIILFNPVGTNISFDLSMQIFLYNIFIFMSRTRFFYTSRSLLPDGFFYSKNLR